MYEIRENNDFQQYIANETKFDHDQEFKEMLKRYKREKDQPQPDDPTFKQLNIVV